MLTARDRGSPTIVAEDGNPDLGQCGGRMAEEEKGVLLDLESERVHKICSCMWADSFRIMSHSIENFEQMLRGRIEESMQM